MSGPIKPSEVLDGATGMPEPVFEVFNRLIAQYWDGVSAIVSQEVVVQEIMEVLQITRAEVFSRNLLNVEPSYRRAGWSVEYDKPGFNETYPATFRFSKRRGTP